MIDQTYQAEITKNLDDQQRRPSQDPAPAIPLFKNFAGGTGGAVAGPLQAGAAWADVLKGYGDVTAAGGASSGGGMFSLPSDQERQQNDAARDKLMTQGLDLNSATGAALRTRAKAFMPDPQATGKAGVILGGLTDFASQAIPAAAAGPAGLVGLATERGVQKAQDLQEQGVDVNTRTAAGIASGTLDAASMLLPMTGPTRVIAAGKGAAGGAAISVVQSAVEKLILQQGGYDKLASTYDPFDPVSIALSSLVPAAFGALHAPAGAAKPAGAARAEPVHADVTLSPAEQAHSDAMEASTLDTDIASLQRELAGQHDEGAKQVLQTELARLQKQKAAPARLDPDVEAAARVTQAAQALDRSRLTPDDDLAGMDQHQQAVETAADQIARGEPVEVGAGHPAIDPELASQAAMFDHVETQVGATRTITDKTGSPITLTFEKLGNHDYVIRATDASGERVGTIAPTFDIRPEQAFADSEVAQVYRRRGIATAMYDFAEEVSGLKLSKSGAASADAQAFWASRRVDAVRRMTKVGRAADEYRAAKAAAPEAAKPNHAAFDQARAAREAGAPVPPKPPKGPRETSATPEGAAPHPGPAANHLEASVAEALRANPDLMVHMDGMEAPMRAADLLEAVRQSAAEDTRDASLLEVAAQCAISL